MWAKIKLFFKNLFTRIYRKPLIKISDFTKIIKVLDKNKDSMLSANEVWDMVIEILKGK